MKGLITRGLTTIDERLQYGCGVPEEFLSVLRTTVPPDNEPLFAAVDRWAAKPQRGPLVLAGPPGIGKTAAAVWQLRRELTAAKAAADAKSQAQQHAGWINRDTDTWAFTSADVRGRIARQEAEALMPGPHGPAWYERSLGMCTLRLVSNIQRHRMATPAPTLHSQIHQLATLPWLIVDDFADPIQSRFREQLLTALVDRPMTLWTILICNVGDLDDLALRIGTHLADRLLYSGRCDLYAGMDLPSIRSGRRWGRPLQ